MGHNYCHRHERLCSRSCPDCDPSGTSRAPELIEANDIREFVLDWLPSDAAGDDFKARLICKLDLLNTTERR